MNAAAHAATLALIRQRRALGIAARRRRIPRQLHPDAIRRAYFAAIRDEIIIPMHAELARALDPVLPALLASAADEHTRHDAGEGKKVNEIIDGVAKDFAHRLRPSALESLARRFAERTSSFHDAQLKRQTTAALGVPLPTSPNITAATDAFVSSNVALIKSIPSRYFGDVEQHLTRAIAAGQRWETIAPELSARYGIAENRAKLIARDQVGKFYGHLNRVRQQDLGVSRFTWQTMEDDRVRDEHQELDGQTFDWDDPPEEGIPGEPVNCRCQALPDFSDLR